MKAGYGLCPYPGMGGLPMVTLIGKHEEPLGKAFEELRRWADLSDGDAIELIFVLMKDGGYLLAIGSEYISLRQRTLGFDRAHIPMLMGLTWMKKLDTTGPHVSELRKYCEQVIGPFCLGVATYRGIATERNPDPSLVHFVSRKQILKFEASFYTEGNIPPKSKADFLLKIERSDKKPTKKDRRLRPPPDEMSPMELHKQRTRMLSTHFPVTLERIKTSPHVGTLRSSLLDQGIAEWQITQALCNLTLSHEIPPGHFHFQGVAADKLTQVVAEALSRRFETAGTEPTPLNNLSLELVTKQIRLDSIALLDGIKAKTHKKELNELVKELGKRGLLNLEKDA